MNNKIIKLSIISVLGLIGAAASLESSKVVASADENTQLFNGNFDNGLDGWTGDYIGEIRDENHTFWAEGRKFYSVGNFLCGEVNESLTGTLKSSTFTLGGDGYITLLLGGNKSAGFVRLVDDTLSETVFKIRNDYFLDNGRSWNMSFVWRQVDSSRLGHTMHFELVDEATGGFGALIVDEICTSLTSEEVVLKFNEQKDRVNAQSDTSALGLADLYNGSYPLPYVGETNVVVNPSFENGTMAGWSYLGTVIEELDPNPTSDASTYWLEGVPFNKEGTYFFNGWNAGAEPLSFGIRSSEFTLGGTGFISWRIAGRNGLVKVVAENGAVIGEFANIAYNSSSFPYVKNGNRQGTMTQVVADLSSYVGVKMHVEVYDSDNGGDWGVLFFDDLKTLYTETPNVDEMYQLVTQSGTFNEVEFTDTDVRIQAVSGINNSAINAFIIKTRDAFANSGLCEIARDNALYEEFMSEYNAFTGVDKEFIDSYQLTYDSTVSESVAYLNLVHQEAQNSEQGLNNALTTDKTINYSIVVVVITVLVLMGASYLLINKKNYKKNK